MDRPSSTATGARAFNSELHRPSSSPSSLVFGDQWDYLFRLICSEYSYCTLYGVNIVDGNIISCDNIQRSLTFGPSSLKSSNSPRFDEFWQALKELCVHIRNGRLAELRFNRGKPVSAKTEESGRKFRRFLAKQKLS